jgi:putative transposase
MVLVTKYRHPVICEDVKDELYKKIREIFEERQLVILEFNGEADHIHILYEAYPFSSPGELANVVKTQSSRYIRKLFGDTVLKKWYWKPYFWSDSYFVATVSENSLSAVRQYIQNQ